MNVSAKRGGGALDETLQGSGLARHSASARHRSDLSLDDSATVILNAAERLFAEQGYGGVTMDELAAEGRTSKRTIYKRYGDKAGLFRAVVRRLSEHARSSWSDEPDRSAPVQRSLRTFSYQLLRSALDERTLTLHRLVAAEAARFPDLVSDYDTASAACVIAAVADYLRSLDGRWPALSSRSQAVAEALYALTLGELHRRASIGFNERPSDRALRVQADRAVETILAALGPPENPEDSLP